MLLTLLPFIVYVSIFVASTILLIVFINGAVVAEDRRYRSGMDEILAARETTVQPALDRAA